MIVTLLTDFGTADHYVAAMKGVILSVDPTLVIVDISHEVPPQDIRAAAYLLACCHRDFPAGTVHLAVVDPGVGSSRLPIAARSSDQFYVGPDNGVFSYAWAQVQQTEVRRIEVTIPGARSGGSTFHGRDLFAPAAAALAIGFPFEQLGSPVSSPVELVIPDSERRPGGTIVGRVLHIDRFGNCVTSLRSTDLVIGPEGSVSLRAGGAAVTRLVPFYAAADADTLFAIIGSSGFVEISLREGSAAERLGLRPGAEVVARASHATHQGRPE